MLSFKITEGAFAFKIRNMKVCQVSNNLYQLLSLLTYTVLYIVSCFILLIAVCVL